MTRWSLRARLFLFACAFSVVIIGAVLAVTYLVVTDAMRGAQSDAAMALAATTDRVLAASVARARLDAAAVGATGADRERRATEALLARLPQIALSGELSSAEYALYAPDGSLEWSSDPRAEIPEGSPGRRAAATERRMTGVDIFGHAAFSGLLTSTHLGEAVVHLPVEVPDGSTYVLDVVYVPKREEAIVDSVRTQMSVLALTSVALTVLMMQVGVAWLLRLVDELRRAADSIEAGDLEVQLPVPRNREIGDLAHSINSLIGRLRRRSEAQSRFIADASHELATPVAGIRGYVNILRVWGAEDAELRDEAIRAIDRESRRMARLCADMLSLIRTDRVIEYRQLHFDLNGKCREVLADAATRYMDKHLEFVGPDEDQLAMIGDPDRVEEVVGILVDNAAKYASGGGQVNVSTRKRRDSVVIEVSDNGPGIPEEDLPNIFDRFYRSDASRSKETGGFGLGLAIAKRIVETAGGTVEVHSVAGVGTTFAVRLPRGRV